eukprot:964753_1
MPIDNDQIISRSTDIIRSSNIYVSARGRCVVDKNCIFALELKTAKTEWVIFKTFDDVRKLDKQIPRSLIKDTPCRPESTFLGKTDAFLDTRLGEIVSYLNKLIAAFDSEPSALKMVWDFLDALTLQRYGMSGDVDTIKYLASIFKGLDLEDEDKAGGTCLHYAAANNRVELVQYLSEKISRLDPLDMFGFSPFSLASSLGCEETLEILKERGISGNTANNASSSKHMPLHYTKSPSERHFLVILNPFSGTKRAERIFKKIVEPIFSLSGIKMTLKHTERVGHASDMMQEMDLGEFDAILCVSGDGIVNEVVNGLAENGFDSLQKPFAVIPAGTGNGTVMTLGFSSPLKAAINCVNCVFRPLDVLKVTQFSGDIHKIRLAIMFAGWGLFSTVDFDSEEYRWMGDSRFTAEALKCILTKRKYFANAHFRSVDTELTKCPGKGCITCKSYDLVEEQTVDPLELNIHSDAIRTLMGTLSSPKSTQNAKTPQNPETPKETTKIHSETPDNLPENTEIQSKQKIPQVLPEIHESSQETTHLKSLKHGTIELSDQLRNILPFEPPDREIWTTIDDNFALFGVMNVTHCSSDIKPAPYAHLSNGLMDLVIVSGSLGLARNVSMLLKIETGDHVNFPECTYRKIREIVMVPNSKSWWDLDGERLPNATTHVEVLPKAACIGC